MFHVLGVIIDVDHDHDLGIDVDRKRGMVRQRAKAFRGPSNRHDSIGEAALGLEGPLVHLLPSFYAVRIRGCNSVTMEPCRHRGFESEVHGESLLQLQFAPKKETNWL